MTDDSKIVLLWKIDNAAAKFATGRVESGVFEEGGFTWTLRADRQKDARDRYYDTTKITLSCAQDRNRSWECEAVIDAHFAHENGRAFWILDQAGYCFDENSSSFKHSSNSVYWSDFSHSENFNNEDTVMIKFVLKIISFDRGQPIFDPSKFDVPNTRSDVVLVIGDKRLHVSKELLAISSPVFETMFFGDFVENGKEEVELKDVVYEEFVDLLHVIYPGISKITDLLALSDRFQIEGIGDHAEAHLRVSKKFTAAQKLAVADKYRLNDLTKFCLRTYKTAQSIGELESTTAYASFSADMKAAICGRMMKLVNAGR